MRKTNFKVESRKSQLLTVFFLLSTFNCQLSTALGQQPQPQPQPIYSVNSKAVQGVGPGNWTYGADVNLYVSPSGSDTTGNGTLANPYQTIGRALRDVPVFVSQHYIIHLAAGTYREEVDIAGRYFGTSTLSDFKKASIELQGDPAAPDSYVISGADAAAPTVPVRSKVVVCSYANCVLNGVSLQYGVDYGFFQQRGGSVIRSSTFRHFTANSQSTALEVRNYGVSILRGTVTVSDAQFGFRCKHSASMYQGFQDGSGRQDILNSGFNDPTTWSMTGIGGVALHVTTWATMSLKGTISGNNVANSWGVEVGDFGSIDSENMQISNFDVGVGAYNFSGVQFNTSSFTNLNTGVLLLFGQAHADWLTSDPVFTNVTTKYNLSGNSWVTTKTQGNLFNGSMTSTGPVSISAGGTNQNITLIPSGSGKIAAGNVSSPSFQFTMPGGTLLGWEQFSTTNPASRKWALLNDDLAFGDFSIVTASTFNGFPDFRRIYIDPSGNIGINKIPGPNAQLDVVKSIVSGLNVVTFSATSTFDASVGNTQKITLTANVTSSTLSKATAGETINFIICQDTIGGRTFVWPTNVLGGMAIGATASKCSAQSFDFDGTNAYALSAGVPNM